MITLKLVILLISLKYSGKIDLNALHLPFFAKIVRKKGIAKTELFELLEFDVWDSTGV